MAEPTAEIILFQAAARGAVIDTMEGFEPTADEGSPVDAWLARAVRSEVMSVRSFQGIARDLQALGAPAPHVRRARPAARDEVAHARLLSGLAHARGSQIVPVCALPAPARSLVAFAMENTAEGCVMETYAALDAGWQARRAPAELRATFTRIAADEASPTSG